MIFPRSKWVILFLGIFLILVPWPGQEKALAIPPVKRTVLPNQLVFLQAQEHSLPFMTLKVFIDCGSRKDPVGEEGLAHLTARGLLLGTSRYTATALNEELDFLGASLTSSSGRDYVTLDLTVLKKNLDRGLELLFEALLAPSFPEKEIRREIDKILAGIQAEEEQPEVVAEKAFRKAFFSNGPYGHPVEGTKESVAKLKREKVLQFYRTHYHPQKSIVVAVGDLQEEEIEAKLISRFAKWVAGRVSEAPFREELARGPRTIRIHREITQANVILGHGGVKRSHPDYYALTLMNYILGGGGFSSRLMQEIRNRRGLAYDVGSFFAPDKYSGSFQIVLQTKNSSAAEAISLCRQQMKRIRQERVSPRELEGAKKYLIGSFPLRLDTQAKLASFLGQVEYFGLGLDYPAKFPELIRSVTREEVLRVAQTYLHPDQYILVMVANLKEAGMGSESSNWAVPK